MADMQTTLAEFVKDTPEGREADAILRKCVHCGFCLATCPTYQLLGDELDSPRGRIYLIKQMLEGHPASEQTQLHLDRCLTCRACETTCPSGVQYAKLLDIGRAVSEARIPRSSWPAFTRYVLRKILPYRRRFAVMLAIAGVLSPVLPRRLREKLPARQTMSPITATQPSRGAATPLLESRRTVVILDGCVQPVLAPEIDAAVVRVLNHLGIECVRASRAGCCGAVAHHLSAHEQALQHAKRNIDALWPHVERGAEAIVMSASACASMLKDYGSLLRGDADYAERAARIAGLTRDISEVVAAERDRLVQALRQHCGSGGPGAAGTGTAAAGAAGACVAGAGVAGVGVAGVGVAGVGVAGVGAPPLDRADREARTAVAFHSPCTLQHGLKVRGAVESVLNSAGFALVPVADAHLCCGSAGTYSILQPELSDRLRENKIAALERGKPAVIATANIGCLTHLRSAATVPVRHWIELIAERLERPRAPLQP
jgi:glycolate oxidase iron-sulfur subunit